MGVKEYKITFRTRGFTDIKNITEEIKEKIHESGFKEGIAVVFVPGATGGVTTMEFEPGVIRDLQETFEKIAPQNGKYHHDYRWGDGNGYAHIRSAIIGTSVSIPFSNGNLQLGMWQSVVFIDFDNKPRRRALIVKILGE
jgi:secondary thiamine-phosphate synthase enzyme